MIEDQEQPGSSLQNKVRSGNGPEVVKKRSGPSMQKEVNPEPAPELGKSRHGQPETLEKKVTRERPAAQTRELGELEGKA